MIIGCPSFQSGQLSETHVRVAHSQMSYPPDRMPERLMYPTLTMSLSLERTFPSCWLVVPCLMVLLMCSKISAVFRGRSPRNFLIFSRILTVFICNLLFVIRPFSCHGWAVKQEERSSPYNRSPHKGLEVTLTNADFAQNSGFIVKPSVYFPISSGNM